MTINLLTPVDGVYKLSTGAYGVDFSDSHAADLHDVERGIMKVAKGLLSHGVTSFCPTLVTSPPAFYQRVMNLNNM